MGVGVAVAASSLVVSPVSHADEESLKDGLALWYELDETSGTEVKDSSGNGRDGTVSGAATWTPGEGLTFNGKDTHIKIPDNLMAGMDAISVDLEVYVEPGQSGNSWFYGLGNSGPVHGDGYVFASGDAAGPAGLLATISTGNWTREQVTAVQPSRNLAAGTWKRVTYTLADGSGLLYEDGELVAANDAVTHKPSVIGNGVTTANYVGRSLYRDDALFKGRIRDFRVYDRALTADEVAELAAPLHQGIVDEDKAALTLSGEAGAGESGEVTADLSLPTSGEAGSKITWSSSEGAVISDIGKVTQPAAGRPKVYVTLTATLTRGNVQETKDFKLVVPPKLGGSETLTRAVDAITVPGLRDVRDNLHLPTTGRNGVSITWRSDRPSVISPDGRVTRPSGDQKVNVGLEATATLNGASATRRFDAVVPPKAKPQALKGYLFSYFTGEYNSNGEQIYIALSEANNPVRFRELNGGKPVLTSNLGEKGLRDPFIIRSPNGDKFYQIATDLKIEGNGDWGRAQSRGSKSIMVWESTDLVNWTDQRLVRISPDGAGNTWAPEAFYDEGLGAYVVFWASAMSRPGEGTFQRMMYATTRDFHTFSEAKPYIVHEQGKGFALIDTTMIKHNGKVYRYTKDERDPRESETAKMIFQEKSDSVLGTFTSSGPALPGDGPKFAAEGPTIYKSNTENTWYLLLDDFGGGGYKAFETTNLDSGVWKRSTGTKLPSSPRHGTVLPVTQAEYDRILKRFPAGG